MNELVKTEIINILKAKKWTIACAESCTGGLLIAHLIDVPGASEVINESYVTYSVEAKNKILGVDKALVEEYGVASSEVSLAMAKGLYDKSAANICIATTGEAGSSLTKKEKAFCYYTIIINEEYYSFITDAEATRNEARAAFCEAIYQQLLELLDK